MTHPDRVGTQGGGTPRPDQISPQVPGVIADTALADPRTLTAINCDVSTLAGEAERRAGLLLAVSVDQNGVAHCIDSTSGAEAILASVAIDSKKTASLVPFELGENQALKFPVSAETPTRFGFFVGHTGEQAVSMAFRMGLYPGLPLVTETVTDKRNREVYVGVRGIKPDEKDEHVWAEQVGLFTKLGFKPERSRGVFNRFHRPNSYTDNWKNYPLVALPDQMLDLLNHYDPTQLKIDTFQLLYYATRDVTRVPDYFPGAESSDYLSFGGFRGATRGGGQPQLYSLGVKGVGVGFGEAVSTQAQVTGMRIESLAGAFEVVVTPK